MERTLITGKQSLRIRNVIISVLIGICMIWELEKLINIPFLSSITQWIEIAELILLGAVMMLINWRDNRWVWILFGGVLLIILTSALRGKDILEQTKPALMRSVLVYLLCPMIGLLLSGESLTRFIHAIVIVWVLFFSILSIIGIYVAANGILLTDYSGNTTLGIGSEGLLVLLDYHQNITASHLLITLMMALIMMFFSQRISWRIFSALLMIPLFVALGLTGSRASAFSAGIGFGLALTCIFRKKILALVSGRIIRKIVICVIVLVISGVSILALQTTQRSFNRIVTQKQGSLLLSAAKAEEQDTAHDTQKTIRERDFMGGNDFLNDRGRVWKAALEAIKHEPVILLTGASIPLAMVKVREADQTIYHNHIHNMPLQILLETGVVGFALCIAFIFLFLKRSWNHYSDLSASIWKRMIFLPALCMMITEMVECITKLWTVDLSAVGMMFFAGLTLSNGLNTSIGTNDSL